MMNTRRAVTAAAVAATVAANALFLHVIEQRQGCV